MNFATVSFVLFFLPVLCLGWILRRRVAWFKWFLVLVSLFFYGQLGVNYLALLLLVAALNWGTVRLVTSSEREATRKWLVAGDVALHVCLLAFYKYAEPLFLLLTELPLGNGCLHQWLMESGMGDVVLPAGLSFYSFMGLSLVIDHYRDRPLPPRSFPDVLAYVSFFPTIMAGPIMRGQQFFPQLQRTRAEASDFNEGICYILSGLFKKVVLATFLSRNLVDPLFEMPDSYSSTAALVGIYAYTIQILCDFSGYTDLAIGIARLMGFRLPQNFESPYRSLNLQEFWRRWHITLSLWLRDYLYIPMGGSRRGNRYANLIVTMVIGGLWHGSGLNFLIWGFFHGLGLAVVHAFHSLRERMSLFSRFVGRGWSIAGKVLAWVLTFHSVAILWVFFRATSFDEACCVFRSVVQGGGSGSFDLRILLIIALVLVMQWVGPACFSRFAALMARLPWVVQALVAGVLGGAILAMGPEGMLPFIYFDF